VRSTIEQNKKQQEIKTKEKKKTTISRICSESFIDANNKKHWKKERSHLELCVCAKIEIEKTEFQ
jgi:hypothetical protein